MQNKDFFANYGTEKWAVEENLCFMLQEYWEAVKKRTGVGRDLPSQLPLNPVSFVKDFMKEETLVDVKYVEMSKMDSLEKNVVVNGTPTEELAPPEEYIDAEVRELDDR